MNLPVIDFLMRYNARAAVQFTGSESLFAKLQVRDKFRQKEDGC